MTQHGGLERMKENHGTSRPFYRLGPSPQRERDDVARLASMSDNENLMKGATTQLALIPAPRYLYPRHREWYDNTTYMRNMDVIAFYRRGRIGVMRLMGATQEDQRCE